MGECSEWVFECRGVFPKLDKLIIESSYTKTPKNVLGRVKGSVHNTQDFDAGEFLLTGKKRVSSSKKVDSTFLIEINEVIKNIGSKEVRKQVVQHIAIHELMHIEEDHFLSKSKDYKKRKTKKFHIKDFDEKILVRYNELRRNNRLPEIKNINEINIAISKLVEDCLKI